MKHLIFILLFSLSSCVFGQIVEKDYQLGIESNYVSFDDSLGLGVYQIPITKNGVADTLYAYTQESLDLFMKPYVEHHGTHAEASFTSGYYGYMYVIGDSVYIEMKRNDTTKFLLDWTKFE